MATVKGKKGKKGSKKSKTAVSTRPPFEYVPIRPDEYERIVTLTVKLVSWSYLNFTVRLPVSTSLLAVKDLIRSQYGGAIASNSITSIVKESRLSDVNTAISGLTDYDRQCITAASNKDIKLYRGSPLTFPPLPDDDFLCLKDVGFGGAAQDEPPMEADLFYDYTSVYILGKGRQRF